MKDFVDPIHTPPQVLTVAAITCRTCFGRQSYRNQDDALCHCTSCENGYEKLMVPAVELLMAVQVQFDDPEGLHDTIARLAEARHVRLPVLTHCTSNLATHLLPRTPRIPLQRINDSLKE